MTTSNLAQIPGRPRTVAARETTSGQQPLATSILLHLVPGAAMLGFVALARPLVQQWGFPSFFAGTLSILFVLLPWEIGYLLYRGQQGTGRLSLRGVTAYRQPMPLRQYIVLVPLLIFWYFQISTAWKQLIPSLTAATAGLPRWLTDPRALSAEEPITASGHLVVAVLLGIVASGIVAPIIEELYFRGYLLPRIDRLGVWAVLLNVVLFAFHHLWTPLDNPGRVLAWFPIILVVWWKRNIRLGFIVHFVTNLLGVLSLLSLL